MTPRMPLWTQRSLQTVIPCLLLVSIVGCDGIRLKGKAQAPAPAAPSAPVDTPDPPTTPPGDEAVADDAKMDNGPEVDPWASDEFAEPVASATGVDFSFSGVSETGMSFVYTGPRHPGMETDRLGQVVNALVEDAVEYGPTLVVWLIDRSHSAHEFGMALGRQIAPAYSRVAASGEGDDAKLLTAVASFGADVQFHVDPPSGDPASLQQGLEQISTDPSGKETPFAAVELALEKYLDFRTKKRREVLFLVITDEAGDDTEKVDALIETPKRYGVPIYVVGVPAPFGRLAGMPDNIEVGFDAPRSGNWRPVRQGPESYQLERLHLGFWGATSDSEGIDSGFGPYALERLCRGSGGRYLAWRPRNNTLHDGLGWPSGSALSFPPEKMQPYAPDYVTAERYQAILAENAARQAVHDAALFREIDVLVYPQLDFEKRSEADLGRLLSLAQQVAARLEPPVNQLYEMLERGEKARSSLTGKRWQANYDLAMGRATALKARVDGYNAMLAALKRGKNFENETSTRWVLQPADSIEASSVIRRLVEQSRTYLERVVEEHPDTPWSVLAQHELKIPLGWEWTER